MTRPSRPHVPSGSESEAVCEVATFAHGFSMADVDRMAHAAVNLHPARVRSIGRRDGWERAWHEIVELLYTTSEPPSWGECVAVAARSVARERDDWEHHHGWNRASSEPAPSFAKFWVAITGDHEDFTAALVERLALPQILALLTPRQYEAVVALALHDSQRQAASALGITEGSFSRRIRAARAKVLLVWLEGETPPTRSDNTCRHGHDRDEHGFKTNEGTWACRICRRNSARRFQARKAS